MNDKFLTWEAAVRWLKLQPEHRQIVLDCYFDDPLIAAATRYWQSSEWAAVRHLLPAKRGNVLDIGSGRGISSFALAQDGWSVTALEPNASNEVGAGAICQLAIDLDIQVVGGTGEQIPFNDGYFDLVYCRQALHHANDLQQLCREAARVLRPDGHFVATREHVLSRKEDLPKFQKDHPLHHLYGGENAYLLEEYVQAIEKAGIRLDTVLNPMESDINLHPQTITDAQIKIRRKLHLPDFVPLPQTALRAAGALSNAPGRLYSFFGTKLHG
jgi:SAM-dependent methyltransferase